MWSTASGSQETRSPYAEADSASRICCEVGGSRRAKGTGTLWGTDAVARGRDARPLRRFHVHITSEPRYIRQESMRVAQWSVVQYGYVYGNVEDTLA